MGALLAIPFIGWLLAPLLAACVAIPFYILWHWCGINQFFDFLPDKFVHIGFWHTIGLFLVVSVLKQILLPHSVSSNRES